MGPVMKSRDLPDPSDTGLRADKAEVPKYASSAVRTWTSSVLLGDAQIAVILHGGRSYQLRRTRNGKLILT